MEGDVENMAALAREPRGEAAVLVMVFEEQDLVAGLREHVRAGETPEAGANDDHVVFICNTFEPVVSHAGKEIE